MAFTEADRKRMGTPHPELTDAVEKFPLPDTTNGNVNASVHDIRQNRAAHLASLRHLYPMPGPIPDEVQEFLHHIPARDGFEIPVKIYIPTKPLESGKGRPLVVMFHEGGWTRGDLTDEDLNCRMFARDLGAVCVNVDYRLAPEYLFPYGVNDAFDAVKWCAKTASASSELLPADPRQGFIVGGASAGGNFAAVMCQMARDDGLDPPLTGQYLCVPALLDEHVVPERLKSDYRSRTESVYDPVIKIEPGRGKRKLEQLKVDPADPRFSPALHPNLKDLPPAFFQIAGLDPLRDEALIYERLLREENDAATKLMVYDGFGHMFWTNWPQLKRSKEFVDDTLTGVKWLLDEERKR
ncbi:hypothetical protein M409DRAFT_66336 [Zasmidium cellare ATCC 36951]|uniref:Alpha/beta hydrolase fold-3 domain-containing protein n=1 Tax=Zasmidium cellare ATCC 36951 TaxID=1080233 RepID=A0A6A6CLC5_ZASCE|nr:uncharacterized protein M409DRAFT_66336 [Zasmidium cellare ATCC 36951]KAF2166742.1 hypothetical protein M409DRAFT_66336 [Zasmidium cellare ATCC 36951]